MESKTIACKNYNIHLIQDKRFHSVLLRVFFTENVTKEKITYRNFLISMLTYATQKYNSKAKILKKCQDIYALYPSASSNRFGNLLTTKFTLCALNSLYIDQDYLEENILLLKEILLNPYIENNGFNKKYFEVVKNEQINEIKTIKEEPRLYSNIKMLDILEPDKTKNYTLTGYSDINIINEMDEKKLYQSYLDMLINSCIDIYVSGNFSDSNEIVRIIKDNFSFPENSHKLLFPYIIHHEKNDKIDIVKETNSYNQSKISIGLKAYDFTDYEIKYVFPVFSIMLGGQSDSILMQEVRSDNSLAYYIGCYHNKLDGILIINSGINKNNYDKVIKLIKDSLYKVSIGKFKTMYLHKSILEYVNELDSLMDTNSNLIEYMYGMDVFKSDTIEKRKEIIKNITKQDIIELCKKIKIKIIFYLEGEL